MATHKDPRHNFAFAEGETPVQLTVAMAETGLSRSTFNRAFRAKRITKLKVGSRTYVLPSEVLALFQAVE